MDEMKRHRARRDTRFALWDVYESPWRLYGIPPIGWG